MVVTFVLTVVIQYRNTVVGIFRPRDGGHPHRGYQFSIDSFWAVRTCRALCPATVHYSCIATGADDPSPSPISGAVGAWCFLEVWLFVASPLRFPFQLVCHRTLHARSCGCVLAGKLLLPHRFLFPQQCAARALFTSRVSFLFSLPSVVLF